MITEHEFRLSGHKDALKELIQNNTALSLALEIIGETAKPRGAVEIKAGAPLDTLVAHKYHRQSGIQAALDHLKRLCEPPAAEIKKEDELESQPFFTTLPQYMKDAIRKQSQENQTPE